MVYYQVYHYSQKYLTKLLYIYVKLLWEMVYYQVYNYSQKLHH